MSKFNECYDISNQIMLLYIDLMRLPDYFIGKDLIKKIKDLIFEEYELIKSLTSEEIDDWLETISFLKNNDDNPVLERIINKLIDAREILKGHYIIGDELEIGINYKKMKFSVYDVILGMIGIDIIKNLKQKIDSLVINCEQDKIFVDALRENLNISKISFLFGTSTSEMLALSCDACIDKIPRIDISIIRDKINALDNNNLYHVIEGAIAYYCKKNIDSFADTKTVDNNPIDVFGFLADVIQLEVLLSYMDDISMFNSVYKYCCNASNDSNKASINYAKRLIKEKMNNRN